MTPTKKQDRLKILWAIIRLRNLFAIWDAKLDRIDKEYVLRRIRDKEPAVFWKIAQEKPR